jgi:hypothetical protein
MLISPASTLNTIRDFLSTGIDGGLPMSQILLQDQHNSPARNPDARHSYATGGRHWDAIG